MSTSLFTHILSSDTWPAAHDVELTGFTPLLKLLVEVLLYVHRNRRFIRDGSPGRPPRLSHSP